MQCSGTIPGGADGGDATPYFDLAVEFRKGLMCGTSAFTRVFDAPPARLRASLTRYGAPLCCASAVVAVKFAMTG